MLKLIVANEVVNLTGGFMAVNQSSMALMQEKMISHS
ncbi:Uncharacterised protein [Vibrio cholerae]|uniref:Uncharacterized protein n=1 Tax=Vibrio cholerae TaxID=666 RepID=A0A655WL65_VIBCL|nr:Uncharacterised protein [Vibrio cholerae]CSA14496.1 Uncharacterised protein [Vibrio cholerae]CSA19965.1 Uncharacterised protein [Vibrio cholerae]CSA39779.1 Uncharacterised protein [Vibrio cholerae]CSA43722.1 Uncharacterised protein [Vibrio cholerae]